MKKRIIQTNYMIIVTNADKVVEEIWKATPIELKPHILLFAKQINEFNEFMEKLCKEHNLTFYPILTRVENYDAIIEVYGKIEGNTELTIELLKKHKIINPEPIILREPVTELGKELGIEPETYKFYLGRFKDLNLLFLEADEYKVKFWVQLPKLPDFSKAKWGDIEIEVSEIAEKKTRKKVKRLGGTLVIPLKPELEAIGLTEGDIVEIEVDRNNKEIIIRKRR